MYLKTQRITYPNNIIKYNSFGKYSSNYGYFNIDEYEKINNFLCFDYMEDIIYEIGYVKNTFDYFIENKNIFCPIMEIIDGNKIFIYCETNRRKEIKNLITDIYNDDYTTTKGESRFKLSCKDKKYIGWVEVLNNFAFFIDENVFTNFLGYINETHI